MLTSPERAQMTTLASARQSHLGSLNDEVRITVRCLRGLPALESWQQKAVWSTKARLLLLRILQWGTQTYVVLDNLWDLKKSPPEDADISGKGADDHIGLCSSITLGVTEWRGADNRKVSPRATSSWVMATKGGVVDKSEALAPTYPPMRNSDLRSSG